MQSFIDDILTPYFDVEKVKLNLPPLKKLSGKSMSGLTRPDLEFLLGEI